MKKIYTIVFTMLMCMDVTLMQAMLTRRLHMGTGRSVPRVATITQQPGKRSIHGQQQSSSWLARQAAAIAQQGAVLKNRLSRWWFGEPAFPIEKELSVPIAQMQQPEVVIEKSVSVPVDKPVADKSAAQIESEEILAKLKEDNSWFNQDIAVILKSPLAIQITRFLESNSLDDIELVFVELLKDDEGCEILEEMCKNRDNQFAIKIIPLMEKNYQKVDTVSSLSVLATLLANVPKEQALLAEKLIPWFFKDATLYEILHVYRSTIWNIPYLLPNDSAKIVALMELLIDKISAGFNRSQPDYPDYKKIISPILNMFISKIAYLTPEDLVKITESLKKIANNSPDIIKNLLSKTHNIKEILDVIDSYKDTPSYRHIQKYSELLGNLNFENTDIVQFKRFIAACCDKEREFAQDYETFYHGRRWQYNYLSDLYTIFYEHQSGKPLTDFIFTHLVEQGITPSKAFLKSETIKRERLIKEGNPFSHDTHLPEHDPALITGQKRATLQQMIGFGNRQTLLFLNKFLFGNIGKRGSCTMSYVLEDSNIGKINFSFKEIFSMFGYGETYHRYEKELSALQSEHEQLTRCGELLQILVPKDTVDKSVYYTTSGGPKKTFYIPGEGNTTDLKKILKYLDQNPKNIVEFVLVNTQDTFGGLNPDSGIKVFSHNLVDPAKMAEFKEKQKQLFDRILESCREHDKRKRQKAIEQEKAQLASE